MLQACQDGHITGEKWGVKILKVSSGRIRAMLEQHPRGVAPYTQFIILFSGNCWEILAGGRGSTSCSSGWITLCSLYWDTAQSCNLSVSGLKSLGVSFSLWHMLRLWQRCWTASAKHYLKCKDFCSCWNHQCYRNIFFHVLESAKARLKWETWNGSLQWRRADT